MENNTEWTNLAFKWTVLIFMPLVSRSFEELQSRPYRFRLMVPSLIGNALVSGWLIASYKVLLDENSFLTA